MTQTGVKVVFGYTGVDGLAATGLTGNGILTTHDYSVVSEEIKIKNAAGAIVTRLFPEDEKHATLEWIFGKSTSVADAIATKATILALRHTILTISACVEAPELNVAWFVNDVKVTGSNEGVHKATLDLQYNAGITASAA